MRHQNYFWDNDNSVAAAADDDDDNNDDDDDDNNSNNNNNNSKIFFSTVKIKAAISSKTRIKFITSQKVITLVFTRVRFSYLTGNHRKKRRFFLGGGTNFETLPRIEFRMRMLMHSTITYNVSKVALKTPYPCSSLRFATPQCGEGGGEGRALQTQASVRLVTV